MAKTNNGGMRPRLPENILPKGAGRIEFAWSVIGVGSYWGWLYLTAFGSRMVPATGGVLDSPLPYAALPLIGYIAVLIASLFARGEHREEPTTKFQAFCAAVITAAASLVLGVCAIFEIDVPVLVPLMLLATGLGTGMLLVLGALVCAPS